VQVAQGDLAEALQSYRTELAIAERLAKADPNDAHWQRHLSIAYNFVGNVQAAQDNLAEALQSFRADLAIADRLAKADPNNAGWHRDLSVSYVKVCDVLVAQGNLAEALQFYRDSQAIFERLARADPNNAVWQRGLAASYDRIGNVLMAQDNLAEALQSFGAGQAIGERLAEADPNNAGWQRDLSISQGRVAETLLKQGNRAEALPLAERALAQLRAAIARMPDDQRLSRDLPYYEDLLRRTGASGGPAPGSEEDLAANVGDRVFFDPGQANLEPDARATLERQAAWLAKYSRVYIRIAGNTDEQEGGTPAAERDLALGLRRANRVRDYLLAHGIAASRIATISYGKDRRPAAAGATAQARAQNRTAVTSLR
jgi:outer membrane protein OmpA-like peptidoglycan-associated protein